MQQTSSHLSHHSPSQTLELGKQPVVVNCPRCHNQITTVPQYRVGTLAVMASIAIGTMLFGLGLLGCCLIPCFRNEFKDISHQCPRCAAIIGTHYRI